MRRTHRSVARDVLLGALSGLAASWVMVKAQERIQKLGKPQTLEREKAAMKVTGDPATYRAAEAIAKPLGVELTDELKPKAGSLVHYATGAAWGSGLALLERKVPVSTFFGGAIFGAAIWALFDEFIVPLIGFSEAPTAYPASVHWKALGSHVVYGTAANAALRALRH